MAERDYAFEALAEVTGTDWNTGRGELNKALSLIREQAEDKDSFVLSVEIHDRAKLYRQAMPDVMLTPSALAKHWTRVATEAKRSETRGTNLHSSETCSTCDGHHFVLVGQRAPVASAWMIERGITPTGKDTFEEYAPCPDCGPEVGGVMDRARAREMMSR